MSEVLQIIVSGAPVAAEATAAIKKHIANKEKQRKMKMSDKIKDALIDIGIDSLKRDQNFFSLHKNPYFIEDFVDPPHNPSIYSEVRSIWEQEENPFRYKPL